MNKKNNSNFVALRRAGLAVAIGLAVSAGLPAQDNSDNGAKTEYPRDFYGQSSTQRRFFRRKMDAAKLIAANIPEPDKRAAFVARITQIEHDFNFGGPNGRMSRYDTSEDLMKELDWARLEILRELAAKSKDGTVRYSGTIIGGKVQNTR